MLIAIILVGLSIASLVSANIAFSKANGYGTDLSTADFLVEQIREKTILLAVTDLYALDDDHYAPPINANNQQLNDLAGFAQHITVENVNPSDFEQTVADGSTSFMRVTVTVSLNSKQLRTESWIRADLTP